MMSRDEIIKLVEWTMKNYGSPAEDKANPGSRLRSQAEHIADVIAQHEELSAFLKHRQDSDQFVHFELRLARHG